MAHSLAHLFQTDLVRGIADSELLKQPIYKLHAKRAILQDISRLGEALGVCFVEHPSQGGSGLHFINGITSTIKDIEAQLGHRLDFPKIGAPARLTIEYRLITPEIIEHAYVAQRICSISNCKTFVEIGWGFGGLARLLNRQHYTKLLSTYR